MRVQVLDATDVKAIVGSGCMWAWFDAVFMSAFFRGSQAPASMAEGMSVTFFAVSAVLFALVLLRGWPRSDVRLTSRLFLVGACAGTAGSLVCIVAGAVGSWGLTVLGGVLGGLFAGLYQMGWGAVYARRGAQGAVVAVAGAFACAVVIDIPLFFMTPVAGAVFYGLLPLVSGGVLLRVPPHDRIYQVQEKPLASAPVGWRAKMYVYLGTTLMTAGGLALVMLGFGYMQHLVSFSDLPQGHVTWGILIQFVRGLVALAMFATVLFCSPRITAAAYRVGLLAMVAGFMVMPFFWESPLFWIPGAIVISGYTVFDIMVWVVTCQAAYGQSLHPAKTVAFVRCLLDVCYVIGAAVGMVVTGGSGAYIAQETNLVGYLVVVSIVFLLSSEDLWVLFNGRARGGAMVEGSLVEPDDAPVVEVFGTIHLDALGLTAREREIAEHLVRGRTQPWIAEALCISGNTVGTHMRHIYQKAGVHNRQEFIDAVLGGD